MENEILSCCFTGHRNIPYGIAGELREVLEREILKLYESGCRRFLSGGAVGFDLMAAEAVLNIKKSCPDVKLIMVLPCKEQHRNYRFGDRIRYGKILESADENIILNEKYCTGCMHHRNKYLVNNSDICIAYMLQKSGGTVYTVNYARECNRTVINLAHKILK